MFFLKYTWIDLTEDNRIGFLRYLSSLLTIQQLLLPSSKNWARIFLYLCVMCYLLEDQRWGRCGCSFQGAEKSRKGRLDAWTHITMINIGSVMTDTCARLSGGRASDGLGFWQFCVGPQGQSFLVLSTGLGRPIHFNILWSKDPWISGEGTVDHPEVRQSFIHAINFFAPINCFLSVALWDNRKYIYWSLLPVPDTELLKLLWFSKWQEH